MSHSPQKIRNDVSTLADPYGQACSTCDPTHSRPPLGLKGRTYDSMVLCETSVTFFRNLAIAVRFNNGRRLLGLDAFLLLPFLLTPCILLGYEIVSCIWIYELSQRLDLC